MKHTAAARTGPTWRRAEPAIHGDWTDQAECLHHNPDLWFPLHERHAKKAIAICMGCPVIQQCDQAVHTLPSYHRYGVWAGTYYQGHHG